jgi:exosortase/archaeosortase family protein
MKLLKKKLSPGFKQFLIKTLVFIGLFLMIQIVTIPLQKIELPSEYYLILDTDLGKALIFTIIIFILLSREKLKNIENSKNNLKNIIFFGCLSFISFVSYFILKNFLGNNSEMALRYFFLFFPLKYLILGISTIFLAIAIFEKRFFKLFIKKFKKEIIISIGTFILALILIIQTQKLWYYLSETVAKIVYFLLSLNFNPHLSQINNLPILGLNNFIVAIDKPCSGVDSLFLFIFLYVFAVGFDWKLFNKKKIILLLPLGVVSIFFINILRIYLLIFIGTFISRDFALGAFHSSASMIFFIIYFALFWSIFYKWMKKK